MARPRTREQAQEGIRERRVTGLHGASKLGTLQEEAARIAEQFGLTATGEDAPTPAEEVEQEQSARRPRILAPNGSDARTQPPTADDAVLAAAERIIADRNRRRPAAEPPAQQKNEVMDIAAGAFQSFLDGGAKPDVAAQLTVAYAILEAANVLASWRDRR